MFKRFFKKFMPEETINEAQADETTPGTPGVEVPAGAVMPGVDMTQGTSQPAEEAPEAPATPEQPPVEEAPVVPAEEPKETTTSEATPAVDPMQPVDRG